MSEEKTFRILTIDGGGIRGIIPAKFLTELESELKLRGKSEQLNEHFDLICGTSTGGIIAIGLALGVSSQKLLDFYKKYASTIFPPKLFKILPRKTRIIFDTAYTNKKLRQKLLEIYSEANNGKPPLLNDLKTSVCIPSYNGGTGEINVLKTKHHPDFNRDYKLPAHEVALSSASAPIYFPPNTFEYKNELGNGVNVNMIDGGIFANNPVMIGLLEATEKLNIPFENIEITSIGTGKGTYIIKKSWMPHNLWYWLMPNPRLLDVILDSQSQITEQYLLFLQRSLASRNINFKYKRVQHDFGSDTIELNASKKHELNRLEAIGGELAKKHLKEVLQTIIN